MRLASEFVFLGCELLTCKMLTLSHFWSQAKPRGTEHNHEYFIVRSPSLPHHVILAQARINVPGPREEEDSPRDVDRWIPAFAGMTRKRAAIDRETPGPYSAGAATAPRLPVVHLLHST